MTLLKVVIEIAKIAIKYGGIAGRITSGQSAVLSRFPPHLRPYAKTVIKGATTVTYGGLVADILKDYLSTGGQNGFQKTPGVKTPTYKPYQTRGGRSVRYRSGNRSRYCPDSRNRYTNTRRR